MRLPPLTVAEFERDLPDDELVIYRNEVRNVECLIAIPRAKLQAQLKKRIEPFWRHGETMHVRLHQPEASA